MVQEGPTEPKASIALVASSIMLTAGPPPFSPLPLLFRVPYLGATILRDVIAGRAEMVNTLATPWQLEPCHMQR